MPEFEFIHRLHDIFGTLSEPEFGIGDDAAILRTSPGRDLLWTTDTLVAGIHFKWNWLSARQLGHRAACVSISDIASMGGKPKAALITFHLPSLEQFGDITLEIARGLFDQFRSVNAGVAGGNLSRAKTFAMEVSLLGEVPSGKAIRRSGAKPGDIVYVSGVPGTAALAELCLETGVDMLAAQRIIQAWRSPPPRVDVGTSLLGVATACIDVSDGLLQDAKHICESSKVGITLDAKLLPKSPDHESAASALGISFSELQQSPSDDYELLFCVSPEDVSRIDSRWEGLVHRIGEVVKRPREVSLLSEGTKVTTNQKGWDHFRETK